MRDILFRGKRTANGEWVYGSLICSKASASIWSEELKDDVEVDPSTVGQYTGLTDKNVVKIFEGDIVRGELGFCGSPNLHTNDVAFVVKYGKAQFDELCEPDYYKFEVIGNVCDNLSLLKVVDVPKSSAKIKKVKKVNGGKQ